MWFGIITVELTGVVFVILGKKIAEGRIELIHDYHWKNVREKDKPFYTKEFSKAMYIMGGGMILSGIGIYIDNVSLICITLLGSIITGTFILNKVQKKYNGGWFA